MYVLCVHCHVIQNLQAIKCSLSISSLTHQASSVMSINLLIVFLCTSLTVAQVSPWPPPTASLISFFQPVVSPPDWDQFALMARYIVHYSDWVGISTIASRDPIMGRYTMSYFIF